MYAGKKMRISEDFLHFLDGYFISTPLLEQHLVGVKTRYILWIGTIKGDFGQQLEDFKELIHSAVIKSKAIRRLGRGFKLVRSQRNKDMRIMKLGGCLSKYIQFLSQPSKHRVFVIVPIF